MSFVKTFLFLYFIVVIAIASVLFQDKALEESMERGSEVYMDFCVTCHLEQGEGVAGAFPPLAQSDYLVNNRKASILGVKFGQKGEIVVNGETYNGVMAPMGLEDDEIADVMNYIMNSFGNSSDKIVTLEEVTSIDR